MSFRSMLSLSCYAMPCYHVTKVKRFSLTFSIYLWLWLQPSLSIKSFISYFLGGQTGRDSKDIWTGWSFMLVDVNCHFQIFKSWHEHCGLVGYTSLLRLSNNIPGDGGHSSRASQLSGKLNIKKLEVKTWLTCQKLGNYKKQSILSQ